jgi:hypothetical protein
MVWPYSVVTSRRQDGRGTQYAWERREMLRVLKGKLEGKKSLGKPRHRQ